MKPKEKKYKEAIERNLATAGREKKQKYEGMSLVRAKIKLGIRKSDASFDDRVSAVCGLPNK